MGRCRVRAGFGTSRPSTMRRGAAIEYTPSTTASGRSSAPGIARPVCVGDAHAGSGSVSSSAARAISAIAFRSRPVHDAPGEVTWRHASACAASRSGLMENSLTAGLGRAPSDDEHALTVLVSGLVSGPWASGQHAAAGERCTTVGGFGPDEGLVLFAECVPFDTRRVRVRGAPQARGPRSDVVRGALEACRLEAREPVEFGSGAVAMRYELRR